MAKYVGRRIHEEGNEKRWLSNKRESNGNPTENNIQGDTATTHNPTIVAWLYKHRTKNL